MEDLIFPVVTFILISITVLAFTGLLKSWAILETLPGFLSGRLIYASIPNSLFFTFVYIDRYFLFESTVSDGISRIIVLLWIISTFYFIWRPPSWIKPAWVRWWESEYPYALPIFVHEAQALGRWTWEKRVWTKAGMSAWIAEVFENHRDDLDKLWLIYKFHLIYEQAVDEEGGRLSADPAHFVGKAIQHPFPEHRLDEAKVLTLEEWEIIFPLIFDEGESGL